MCLFGRIQSPDLPLGAIPAFIHNDFQIVDELKEKVLKSLTDVVPPTVARSIKQLRWTNGQLAMFFLLSGSRKGWPSNFAGVISPGWCEAR